MKRIGLVLFLILTPMIAFSQENGESYFGDEIVITATRTEIPHWSIGRSISLITSKEIERQGRLSVTDILSNVSGLDVTQNGGVGQPSSIFIRGAKSGHMLVMIDGIEMNDPISPGKSYNFAHLIPNGIEQIEVVKGPHSTLYGSDAMGGVINIITKKGIKTPVFSVSGEAGSYGTYREHIHSSGANDRFRYALSLMRLDSDGFSSAGEKYNNIEKDGYKNTSVSGKAGVDFSPNASYDVTFHHINSKTDLDNFGGLYGDDPNYTTDVKEYYINNRLTVNTMGNRMKHSFAFSLTDNKRDYLNERDTEHPDDFIESNYKGKLYTFGLQNDIFTNKMNTLAFGIEYEKEKGNSYYFSDSEWGPYTDVFPDKETSVIGVYLQDNINIGNTLMPTVGVRYDKHNVYGSSTTFQIAPAYLIHSTNTKFRASYATGFKAPSLYQLYSGFGDENLKAEEVRGFDIGVEQYMLSGIASVSASYYNNKYTNMIDYDNSSFKYNNIGEASSEGLEIEANITPVPNFYIKGFYTYLKTEDKTANEELLRRPKHKCGISASKTLNKLQFTLDMLYVGKRYDKDYSTYPETRVTLRHFAKIDISASVDILKNAELFARIDNIADQDYEYVFGYGTPGRSFFSGIRLKY
ncbi:TonB-dependent receptor plug domain-containing protein [candidate division KSB1 bacterium]